MFSIGEIKIMLESGDKALFARADALRRKLCGDDIYIRGIIEYSNICMRNCAYCGLRRDNKSLVRYSMSADEVLEVVHNAAREGIKTVVLQGGENDNEPPEFLEGIIREIKKNYEMSITLSSGNKSREFYSRWKIAGADRYLIKFESVFSSSYNNIPSESRLAKRISAISELKSLGYQVGSGSIVGLPGFTNESLATDIALAERLDLDMASFGPFVAHNETPLRGMPNGDLETTLRVIAVARLALRRVHIPATTSLDAIASDGRERALMCGANVIMANLTPKHFKQYYDIYPADSSASSLENIRRIIKNTGSLEASGHGHSLKQHDGSDKKCSARQKV